MNPPADLSEDQTPLTCHQCGRKLPGGLWFARLNLNGVWRVFCRPSCVEKFLTPPAEPDFPPLPPYRWA
jgi:hypothetical protein